MHRRDYLRLMAAVASLPLLHGCGSTTTPPPIITPPPPDNNALLDQMQRAACLYFTEQVGTTTGQVLDRAAAFPANGTRDARNTSSIAATGFGLTALCIADSRGYASSSSLLAQAQRTLDFYCNTLTNVQGFFYHFNDVDTGARLNLCEVSSIDTAILMCGVLAARAHFSADAQVQQLATTLYERVNWPWMLNGGATFSMGWTPESGFLTGRWDHYSELMMLYLLALGSPTFPIDAASWSAFSRPTINYDNYTYISGADPLFVHQYSHAWFDFRSKHDAFANYFNNSITATQAHKAFCIDLGPPYTDTYWGISASDSQNGYQAWGGPPAQGQIDGSIVPYATASSLPFLPTDCLQVQQSLNTNYAAKALGRYGFCDALHPATGWYDPDVLGIDLGIGLLMAENYRTGFVWQTFAQNPEVSAAMQRAGFVPD